MNKYDRLLKVILRRSVGILGVLFSLALVIGCVFLLLYVPALIVIMPILLLGSAIIFNISLGFGFLNDKYVNLGYVVDGNTQVGVVETTSVYKRRMILCFVMSIIFVICLILCIILLCNKSFSEIFFNNEQNNIFLIITTLIESLVGSIILIITGLKYRTEYNYDIKAKKLREESKNKS